MTVRLLAGDCREVLPTLDAGSVSCCVTSPPYFGLRDYGHAEQIGLEPSPDAYVATMVEVFREVRRVLADDGTLWLNLGDSYASSPASGGEQSPRMSGGEHKRTPAERAYQRPEGLKAKDLVGIPWRVAFALQADGWWLRQDIVWHKPNPMPESVTDRCTKAHEYVFLLAKSARYYFDADALREPPTSSDPRVRRNPAEVASGPMRSTALESFGLTRGKTNQPCCHPLGRNRRSVWTIPSQAYDGAHFATFPPALARDCILAGCPPGGVVLDPFAGAGTTGLVADRLQRDAVLIELNPDYGDLLRDRIMGDAPLFTEVVG